MFLRGAVCRWRRRHACPVADNGGTTSQAAHCAWNKRFVSCSRRDSTPACRAQLGSVTSWGRRLDDAQIHSFVISINVKWCRLTWPTLYMYMHCIANDYLILKCWYHWTAHAITQRVRIEWRLVVCIGVDWKHFHLTLRKAPSRITIDRTWVRMCSI